MGSFLHSNGALVSDRHSKSDLVKGCVKTPRYFLSKIAFLLEIVSGKHPMTLDTAYR